MKKKFNWADISYDSDFTPTPVSDIKPKEKVHTVIEIKQEPVILQAPPVKLAIIKRKQRGEFETEDVSGDRHTGSIKFYNLKKRFGFVSMDDDSTDVFICEDDLIVSGINHKKFKQDVFNKEIVRVSFCVKSYVEKGKTKRKAIEIEVLDNIKTSE